MSENYLKNNGKVTRTLQSPEKDLALDLALDPTHGASTMENINLNTPLQEALREFHQNAADANNAQLQPQNSGFQTPNKVGPTYELHVAAQEGDIGTIKKLLAQGLCVNQEDFRSAMPVHIATLFGHVDLVKFLISEGADLSDRSYRHQTALHLATELYRTEIVAVLLANQSDPLEIDADYRTALDNAAIRLDQLTDEFIKYPDNSELMEKTNAIVEIIQHLCENIEGNPTSSITPINSAPQLEPISIILDRLSSYVPNAAIRSNISQLVETLREQDDKHDNYLQAKTFLNIFATSQQYLIQIEKYTSVSVNTDGFTEKYITHSIAKGLDKFSSHIQSHSHDIIEQKVATHLAQSFEMATQYAHSFADKHTAELALQHYHNNETILLPTGWRGHSVATFFSKANNVFAVANAGPHYSEDKPGVHFYKMNDVNSLNADKIHGILTNQSQLSLELYKLYELGIIEKLAEIETPKQTHGNCTYYSFKIIVEALAWVEYINQGVDYKSSQAKAKSFSQNFELYQNLELIDNILQEDSPVPINAFKDIYHDLHEQGGHSEIAQRTADYLHKKLLAVLDIDLQTNTHHDTDSQTLSLPEPAESGWFKFLNLFGFKTESTAKSPQPNATLSPEDYQLMDFESERITGSIQKSSAHNDMAVEPDTDTLQPFSQQLLADIVQDTTEF